MNLLNLLNVLENGVLCIGAELWDFALWRFSIFIRFKFLYFNGILVVLHCNKNSILLKGHLYVCSEYAINVGAEYDGINEVDSYIVS